MDVILNQLGGILLRALPTFFLVVLLHFYLKYVFFRPLERLLRSRYEATEGARKLAEASVARADAKAAEYEAALRKVRAEIYLEQEKQHRQLADEQAAAIKTERARTDEQIRAAKAEIEAEAEAARRTLDEQAASLAEEIAGRVLGGRAA